MKIGSEASDRTCHNLKAFKSVDRRFLTLLHKIGQVADFEARHLFGYNLFEFKNSAFVCLTIMGFVYCVVVGIL